MNDTGTQGPVTTGESTRFFGTGVDSYDWLLFVFSVKKPAVLPVPDACQLPLFHEAPGTSNCARSSTCRIDACQLPPFHEAPGALNCVKCSKRRPEACQPPPSRTCNCVRLSKCRPAASGPIKSCDSGITPSKRTNAARAGCRHLRNNLCITAVDRLAIAERWRLVRQREARVRAAESRRDARDSPLGALEKCGLGCFQLLRPSSTRRLVQVANDATGREPGATRKLGAVLPSDPNGAQEEPPPPTSTPAAERKATGAYCPAAA